MERTIDTYRLWEISKILSEADPDSECFNVAEDSYEEFLEKYSFKLNKHSIWWGFDIPDPYEDYSYTEDNLIPLEIYKATDAEVAQYAKKTVQDRRKEDQIQLQELLEEKEYKMIVIKQQIDHLKKTIAEQS